jgi:Transposase domain (DUF772)
MEPRHLSTTCLHPFYGMLNRLLNEAEFDAFVDNLCPDSGTPFMMRPAIYFRMLLVGYFEGIDSQRGIAWRCRDSRSLQEFLGFPPGFPSPDYSALAAMARRLPAEAHEQVFAFVLKRVEEKKLFQVQTVLAAEPDYREADAAMKSIQRQDALGDYKPFLLRLTQEASIENPLEENPHVFDKDATRSPASRLGPTKGRAHLADKSEHVLDLEMTGEAAQGPVWKMYGGNDGAIPDIARSADRELARRSLEVGWDLSDSYRMAAGIIIMGCGLPGLISLFTEEQTPSTKFLVITMVYLFSVFGGRIFLAGKNGWPIFPWDY